MKFRDSLKDYKKEVDQALKVFFNQKIREVKKYGSDAEFFIQTLSRYTLGTGAKRIRAILTLVSYELFKAKRLRGLMDVSMALELIHSYLLIHDDIIDHDDFRRSQPTVHKKFEAKYKKRFLNGIEHLGQSLAIILGDTADTLAIQLIANSTFSPEQKTKAISLMYGNIEKTLYGEMLDVLGCETESDIKKMIKYKTALYTFVNPLLIGASLAGASAAQSRKLEAYGNNLGIAFQIQDDILGLFGQEKVTGKPVGSDLREKKNTLLIHETKKRISAQQKRKFNEIWNKPRIANRDIQAVQSMVANSGALEYNQSIARKLANRATAGIKGLIKVNKSRQQFLIDLADFVISRDK